MGGNLRFKMKTSFALVLLVASCCLCYETMNIGDGLWRTFNKALNGDAPPLPLTAEEASSQGWQPVTSSCDPNLGIQYTQNSNKPEKSTPLSVYYTAGGQVAGVGVNVYESGAAPDNLVSLGFWIPVSGSKNEWMLSVSFRPYEEMCNSSFTSDMVLGDRLVINQGSLNYSLPLTAAEAYCGDWTYGSCMTTMGEHWFYDVSTAPQQSWQAENLLPVVTMYYPPNMNGTISTIFFTTPVKQPGSDYLLYNPGDWESPALTPRLMCENYCDDNCEWPGVSHWSTMHVYLNSQWSYITCPNGKGVVGRECPDLDYSSVQC